MNALYSIPPPVIHEPAQTGLLYASTADLLTWGMALIALAALCFMPGQLRESAKALWAPWGRALRSLCCPWLWKGCFLWTALSGAFLRPILRVLWFIVDLAEQVSSRWGREGFWGWWPPLKV